MPTFSIRRANPTDADGILRCLHTAFSPYRDSHTSEGFADTVLTPAMLKHRLGSMSLFVALSPAGEVVGTIGCHRASADEGHIRGMAVLPACQGSGLAAQLLQAAEAELKTLGCRRVTLDTTEPLQRAIRFYEKAGYRASGRVADFFGMPLFEYVKLL